MRLPPVTSAFVVPWRSALDSGLLAILPVGAVKNEPSAVCAARPGDNAGFVNVGTHHLNTANVGSTSRDFSRHVATGSNRPCCAVHPDDSACPPMFWVHSVHISKVRDTSTHLHLRVMSLDRCCLVWKQSLSQDFLTHGLCLAAVMGRHVGQWTVQCAFRESLVHGLDTLLEISNVEFHGQCAARLRQARELGEGERNIQDRVLCRRAQFVNVGKSSKRCCCYDEREDAPSELYALPKRLFREAHQASCQSGTCWGEFVFRPLHVFFSTVGVVFKSVFSLGLCASTVPGLCAKEFLLVSFAFQFLFRLERFGCNICFIILTWSESMAVQRQVPLREIGALASGQTFRRASPSSGSQVSKFQLACPSATTLPVCRKAPTKHVVP